MLAVVEHNQRAPILEMIDEPFHGGAHRAAPWRRIGAGAALAHSELGGHRARHHLAVGDPSQIGKPHPVRERHQHLGGDLHRQPRLARPAGPGDRAQPVGVEQVNQLGDLVSSPDEPSHLYRQIVGTVVQGPERREVGGQRGMLELVEAVRLGQVGEPMDAEIEQLRPGGEAGHGERPGCLGHEHLTAVPGPAHRLRGSRRNGSGVLRPCRPLDVDPHPHPHRRQPGWCRLEGLLGGHRGADGLAGTGQRDHCGVLDAAQQRSAEVGTGLGQHSPVAVHRRSIPLG